MNTTRIPPSFVLKQSAKESMRAAGKGLLLFSLVYWGIDFVISLVLQGTVPEEQYLLATGLTLAVNLLLSILSFGFRGLCLDAARGEPELPLSGLLAGTHLPLRVFGMVLLQGLLGLFYGFPYTMAMILGAACVGLFPVFGLLIAIPAYFWSLWGILKVAARYSLGMFILWDRPEMPAMDCLNLSRTMTEGHEGKLIWLEISFLGWMALGVVTGGLAMILVNPYMQITTANFYRALGGDRVLNPQKPEEPQESPDLRDAFTSSAYRDHEEK